MYMILSTVLVFVVVDLVLGQDLTYDHGKNCDADVIMNCSFSGVFDPIQNRKWKYPNSSNSIISAGTPTGSSGKYTEDIPTPASSYFTMTIKEVELADAGTYYCEYIFAVLNVTLDYECYGDITGTCSSSNKVIITVDRVYPNLTTTTLTVALSDSTGTAISGAVVSEASITYTDHFKLTWTSNDTVPDGTYTYTVAIQTNAAGTPVTIADNLSVPCGGGGGGLGAGAIAGIACGCCVGAGVICAVTYVGVKQYKKSKKGSTEKKIPDNRVSPKPNTNAQQSE